MKKLMIAATIAALAGASFADCQDPVACPFGYRMKVMVRTTVAKTAEAKSACVAGGCYRNPAIRRFLGFVYGTTTDGGECDGCQCNGWSTANVAFWDYDARKAVDLGSAELILLDRIGYQQTDKCEMCFQLGTVETDGLKTYEYGSLCFSGFGTCGIRQNQVTVRSVAGYCAGYLPSLCSAYNKTTCGEDLEFSTAWELCSGAQITPVATAAYGKWTLTWDDWAAAQVSKSVFAEKAASYNGVLATPVLMGDMRNVLTKTEDK